MLMARGAPRAFSIGNDVAKYFASIPATLVSTCPQLST
jgi:high-affinity K+ transport system ATPase subunit B